VLFDFDGTLVDSAPDLVEAVNEVRKAHRLEPLPYEALRPFATYGARSLLQAGLGLTAQHASYPAVREQFLRIYDERKLTRSRLFAGVEEVLTHLTRMGMPWGIVTNKHARFAEPMVDALLTAIKLRPSVLLCGDSTPEPKPHPLPLTTAAERLRCASESCWYVGDGENDLLAAKAAGMTSILATYGYLPDRLAIEAWPIQHGSHRIDQPSDLLPLLERAGDR